MAHHKHDSVLAVLSPIPVSAGLAAAATGAYVLAVFVSPTLLLPSSGLLNGVLEFAPYLALLVAVVFVFTCFWELDRRRFRETSGGSDPVRAMDRQNFELLVAQGFRRLGYAVDNRGWYAPNRVPISLEKGGQKILVACKQWGSGQFDLAPVRALYDAMQAEHASGALVVTPDDLTPEAQAFVEDKPIGLITGDGLRELIEPVQTPSWEQKVTQSAPTCPVCERPMVKTKSGRGSSWGPWFWGCSAAPSCKGARRM